MRDEKKKNHKEQTTYVFIYLLNLYQTREIPIRVLYDYYNCSAMLMTNKLKETIYVIK